MFLETLATYVVKQHGKDLSGLNFIFPNRRSGLFFKQFLVQHSSSTSWSPGISTINELMAELSGSQISDPLDVIFELYDLYKELVPQPEPFDEFFPWGEMMISDFDTLDKYLVDPGTIFRNIREMKEIDESFGKLEEEQVEFIRRFWKSFHQGESTREKELFLSTWKLLPALYHDLCRVLEEKQEGYEGRIYRQVAEMEWVDLDRQMDHEHYYFVGFNALSTSEKRLFRKLQNRGVASFFWDCDVMYMENQAMEAGKFLRENIREFPPPADLEIFNNLQKQRPIRIFDLPSDVLQAKTVNQILKERSGTIESAEDTAIIACDENLLMPLLVSLPDQVDLVNITMGYPFRNTPLNSFVEAILRMYRNARSSSTKGESRNERTRFYNRDVLSVLNHQYYKLVSGTEPSLLVEKIIHENHVYVDPDFFQDEFARKIFCPVYSAKVLCSVLDELLKFILRKLQVEDEHQYRELEKEYMLSMLMRLNKLSRVTEGRSEVELHTFMRLFRRVMTGLRIPFTGEPLAGLQIMGILETRLLDFKHVIMVSVNEDIMPASTPGSSFIPYSMRYAYGLPTREEMDAIYAYYFYRIIQRADQVDLLFKSASEGIRSGEMSRYLYQMKYDFDAKIIRPAMQVSALEQAVVRVEKTPGIMNELNRYLAESETGTYLSPSSLNTYIECSLKFYLRKIAHIQEQEEILEELDPIGFGNILHHTIHELYTGISERREMIGKDDLEQMLKGDQIDVLLRKNFTREYFKSGGGREIEGRNLVILAVLKKYLVKIIETDISITPFDILELEQEYVMEVVTETGEDTIAVKIGGKIDRVDRPGGGFTRIIDYKTGGSETSFESVGALFDPDLPSRSKEAFQAFVYAALYLDRNADTQVMPGLYVVRKMFGDRYAPEFRMGARGKKLPVTDFREHREEFLMRLQALLAEIFNPDIPFTQTKVTDRCKYCDFKEICNRS